MKEALLNALPTIYREMIWLFASLIGAAFLASALRMLLQLNPVIYDQVVAELPAESTFYLQMLLFGLCLLGVYVGRLAVAAIDSLLEA